MKKIDGVNNSMGTKIDSVNNSLNEKIDGVNNNLEAIIDGIKKKISNQYFVKIVALSALLGTVFTVFLTAIRYFWFK